MSKELAALGVVALTVGAAAYYSKASDVDILARTIWGEARGETSRGRVAVANVIMNRVADPRWPNTVEGVCKQPFQFSTWNQGDPNRARMLSVATSDDVFRECVAIARKAVFGLLGDVTGGANHYHARYVSPGWASAMTKTEEVGAHLFFVG